MAEIRTWEIQPAQNSLGVKPPPPPTAWRWIGPCPWNGAEEGDEWDYNGHIRQLADGYWTHGIRIEVTDMYQEPCSDEEWEAVVGDR